MIKEKLSMNTSFTLCFILSYKFSCAANRLCNFRTMSWVETQKNRKKGEEFGFSKLKDRYIHALDPALVLGVLLSQKKVHSRECSKHGFYIHYVRGQRLL